jgi:alkanesulfonate monooxygenase SsuD/methylene tetrahydromethanopterin reductase-like flavin-dependent oxidoreductase (luciferase family)
MKFALMTEPQLGGTYDQLVNAARRAEAAGLDGFARSDHFYWSGDKAMPATEAFATLGGIARETQHIRLTVLVTPITFRHPAVIAKAATTLDQMSGGRFDLGVGTGWMDAEHEAYGIPFPESNERFLRLTEALQYLRASFSGTEYAGQFYGTRANALPRPTGLRMIVGGSGPRKTPALAGRFADEYNHFVNTPEVLAPKVELMREEADKAGREADKIMVSVMGPAVVADDERELGRLLAEGARMRNIEVAELRRRWDTNGVPYGTVDQVMERLGKLAEVGVSKYYLQWLYLDDTEGLDRFITVAGSLSR